MPHSWLPSSKFAQKVPACAESVGPARITKANNAAKLFWPTDRSLSEDIFLEETPRLRAAIIALPAYIDIAAVIVGSVDAIQSKRDFVTSYQRQTSFFRP